VLDLKREDFLPYSRAQAKNPFESSTLPMPHQVIHKVIHTIGAKVWSFRGEACQNALASSAAPTFAGASAPFGGACTNLISQALPLAHKGATRYILHPDRQKHFKEFFLLAILYAAGWPIIPLLVASIVALTLIVERILYLRRNRILPSSLLQEVIRVYHNGKINSEVIDNLENNSPLGRVLAAGLRNVSAPREVMKEAIEEAGRGTAHDLERFLTTLGTIATLAPLMGLFGTVVGMIEIFGSQNATGANPTQLAHGISVALYNTGFGLAIAMPALVFYRHFRALVDDFIVDMEQQAVKFVDIVHNARR
jgi:biopolymer transport protein ExbB